MSDNIKTHLDGFGKVMLCYVLTVILSWAAFPIIVIVLSGIATPDICLSIYTFISMMIYCIITYMLMHGYGEKDLKPYKWVKYPMKGLVCGAFAALLIILIEHIFILIANKYVIVNHPTFNIETLNAYVRIAFMMPFYWLFRLLEGKPDALCPVPSATYLNSFLPGIIIILPAMLGYLMGQSGKRIFKGEVKNKVLRAILYPKPKRVRQEEKKRKEEERKKRVG